MSRIQELLSKIQEEVDFDRCKDCALEAAKDMFGDKFDSDKADKVVNGMIAKMKNGEIKVKDTEEATKILKSVFRR